MIGKEVLSISGRDNDNINSRKSESTPSKDKIGREVSRDNRRQDRIELPNKITIIKISKEHRKMIEK